MILVLKRQIQQAESLNDEYDWLVGAYSIEEKNLILNIQYTEWSKTFFKDRESYLKFTGTFKTTTGSWNGTSGYWLTAKLFQQRIICSNYSQLKPGSAQSGNSVFLNKKEDENFISVHIESTAIGLLDFECTGLQFEGVKEIALFNSETRQWEWHTHSFDSYSHFQFETESE
jgi:hypothetical protein